MNGRFEWLYEQNPLGAPVAVAAVDEGDGKIVGCCSLLPLGLNAGGKVHQAGMAVDFVLDVEHRVFGPALLMQRMLGDLGRTSGMSLVLSYPNREARGVFSRLGYEPVGDIRHWSKILRSGRKLLSRTGNHVLASVAGPLIDFGLLLRDRWFWPSGVDGGKVEVLEQCDGRFDLLWEKAKRNQTVAVERSAEYLQWRFATGPLCHRFCCLSRDDGDVLDGIIVYRVVDNMAVIADAFAVDDHSFRRLLACFISMMRRENRDSISVSLLCNERFHDLLRSFRFIPRPTTRTLFVDFGSAFSEEERGIVRDPRNWCVFDDNVDL